MREWVKFSLSIFSIHYLSLGWNCHHQYVSLAQFSPPYKHPNHHWSITNSIAASLPLLATDPNGTAMSSSLSITYSLAYPTLVTPPLPSPAALFFGQPRPPLTAAMDDLTLTLWPLSLATHSTPPPTAQPHPTFFSFSQISIHPSLPPLLYFVGVPPASPQPDTPCCLRLTVDRLIVIEPCPICGTVQEWERCRLVWFNREGVRYSALGHHRLPPSPQTRCRPALITLFPTYADQGLDPQSLPPVFPSLTESWRPSWFLSSGLLE